MAATTLLNLSGGVNAPLTAQERAQRSVFVGNIPYEATEDQLKEIFLQAGPVVSFRLVYDRETGKPKGYGFCEYQDVETAQSAMRNLNNHDFNGRPLRVGVAAGEQSKDEIKGVVGPIGGPGMESPYGDAIEPSKAPEAISKAVASLPPEQMFELMKQMKLCIQNNPNEARNMLLENPQLAYALLQAQIVMKIVDPQVAIAMLHRQSDQIPPLLPTSTATPAINRQDPSELPGFSNLVEMEMNRPRANPTGPPPAKSATSRPPSFDDDIHRGPSTHRPLDIHRGGQNMDMREDGRGRPPPSDMHGHGPSHDIRGESHDIRSRPDHIPPDMRGPAPRMPHHDMVRGGPGPRPRGPPPTRMPEHRLRGMRPPPPSNPPGQTPNMTGLPDADQEKTSLIMQVLKLSDEQIEMLPPDQRQSIMVLKEQISRTGVP